MPDSQRPPSDFVHEADPEVVTIRVGEQTFTKPINAPLLDTCKQVAREMGIGGSFTIIVKNEEGRKMLGKDLPSDFTGYSEVELVKYDSGGI